MFPVDFPETEEEGSCRVIEILYIEGNSYHQLGSEYMPAPLHRIGILTGGGDCPGLNAVIRSIAKPALSYFNADVIGILDGFEGFVEGRTRELTKLDVTGIINLGGYLGVNSR